MKVVLVSCFLTLLSLCVSAQNSEAEYKVFYGNSEWSASDLIKGLDTLIKYTDFKFVKDLKNLDIRTVKATVLNLLPNDIKQVNIDAWYFCSVKNEDLFNLWNLYYNKINRKSFENYCVLMSFIMVMDGVLITKN